LLKATGLPQKVCYGGRFMVELLKQLRYFPAKVTSPPLGRAPGEPSTDYTLHLRPAATDCYAAKGDVIADTLTTGQLAIISGSFDVTDTADLKAGAELSVENVSMADEESNPIGSSFTYAWYRSDNNVIDGDTVISTEATYTLVKADEGKYIYVVVGATGFIGGQPSTVFGPVPIPTHALTIDLGGGTGGSASGSYAENTVVSINAGMKSGYTFAGWTATAGTLANPSAANTTFIMPAEAVTLTASWTQNQVPAPNPNPNPNPNRAPDQDITREQLATIIYRYVQAGGGTLTPVRAYVPFSDELEASEYAREAIARLYELGILNGKSGERFDPKGLATRGEVAAIIKRLTDILGEMP